MRYFLNLLFIFYVADLILSRRTNLYKFIETVLFFALCAILRRTGLV